MGHVPNFCDDEVPFFPPQDECDFLHRQYFAAVDPLAHLLCKRDFDHTVGQVYESTCHGMVSYSMKALILAVCFAAAISLPFQRSQISLGVAKSVLVERCKLAIEHYLQKPDVLGTLEQEAMQAAIIYLVQPRLSYTIRFANAPQIPICRCEISRSISVFVAV